MCFWERPKRCEFLGQKCIGWANLVSNDILWAKISLKVLKCLIGDVQMVGWTMGCDFVAGHV